MSNNNNNNNRISITRAHVNANQLIQQAKNNGTYAAKKAENNAMIRNSASRAFSKNTIWPHAQITLNTNNKRFYAGKGKKNNSTTLKKRANKAARNVNNLKMGGRRKRKTRRHKKHKRRTHKRKLHHRRRTPKRKHRRNRHQTRRRS